MQSIQLPFYNPDSSNINDLCMRCNHTFTFEISCTEIDNSKKLGEGRIKLCKFFCYYLTLYVYKMVNDYTGEYKLVDIIKYEINPYWTSMYSELTLVEKGFYKLEVYHEDGKQLDWKTVTVGN